MSTTIGEVNINLRMSLAQFRQDVQDGGSAASKASKDMASAVGSSSREATGSLALIGEELGIHIPRHLRTFITTIPGVGTALSAAFSSVAVLALIEVIVKVIEKIVEYRDHIAASAQAWDKANQQGIDSLRTLDAQILSLQIRLDELQHNHIAALADKLKEIDLQSLQHIRSEFDKVAASSDEAFKKMNVGWAGSYLFGQGNDAGVQRVHQELDSIIQKVRELTNVGNRAGIGDVINNQIESVMNNMGDINSFNGQEVAASKAIYDALQKELDQLNLMYAEYQKINVEATKKDKITTTEAENAAHKRKIALLKEEAKILAETKALPTSGFTLSKGGTPLGAGEFVDASAMANSPSFPSGSPTPPIYGGSKDAKDLLDLQGNINEQILRGQELFQTTRTAAEKYDQEIKVLNTLLQSGAIDQNTYNRAVTEAKAKYDDLAKGIAKIGDTVGRDIANAALYGGSWSKAFQDIGAEILKVILQMTVLKALQNANSAAGGGGFLGFFTSLVGGLSGKASGGPVYQGQGYMVGENGPEFFSPSTSGTIIPNSRLGGSGGPVVNHYEFNFTGVQDADSFRQSESQIAASMAAQMSRHAQRNG